MKQNVARRLSGLGALLVVSSLVLSPCRADLINPDFETGDFTGWTVDGSGHWRIGTGADNHTPSGNNGAVFDAVDTLVAPFPQFFVLQQELAAAPSQVWDASTWIRTVNLSGNSESWLEVQFWDSGNSVLDQLQSAHVTADQSFTQMTLGSMTAPSGTAAISVRGVVMVTDTPSNGTDFHIFDDFQASVIPEPVTAGLLVLGLLGLAVMRHRPH